MNRLRLAWTLTACLVIPTAAQAQDVNEETEKSMKAAVAKVAPAVVRIETSGGQDMIVWTDQATGAPIRKVVGPTTGLVVDADGYIVTSSFNFINKPTDIFVTVPGKPRSVAKVIATDQSRMLTLLKTDLKGLTVPAATPKKDIAVGQWSLALGRTINPSIDQLPSMSAGIISAVGRIWGKAVQCDGKISPVNYGGPIIDIEGRVQGVLVPASHTSEGDNAGIEWYDSGIGFGIPLEDVFRVLPKLKVGTPEKHVDLRGGLFGIPQPSPAEYLNPPIIKVVIPDSAADKAGIKANDQVLSVDDKPVHTMAQFLHAFKPLYEGDTFSMKVKRGDKEVSIAKVVLQGSQASFETGFLGILPMRDDPDPGVEIRYVYPDSPAAKAGLKVGDRIMQIGTVLLPMRPFSGRNQFAGLMSGLASTTELQMEVKRAGGGKTEKLTARLVSMPESVPETLPREKPTKERAREQPKDPNGKGKDNPKKDEPKKDGKKEETKKEEKFETGKVLNRTNEATGREYWIYIPRGYNPNVSYGLLVWLHAGSRAGRDADDMMRLWDDFCDDHQVIMMGPISQNKEGWVPSEADDIVANMNVVMGQYTIDRQRIIMHGHGIGGQMAYYMGFHSRDLVRGVATVSAVLATQTKDSIPNQRLQFLILGGQKDLLIKEIKESRNKLVEKKYNVIFREMRNIGKQYLDDDSDELKEMFRWIDSLDRQ